MTIEDAKKTLSFYRPGSSDMRDPEFAEALELVRRSADQSRRPGEHNPELVKWFEDHCASYAAGRAKLQEISVPAGLREQIIAERKIVPFPMAKKRISLTVPLALAAAVAALLCLLPFVLRHGQVSGFVACRNEMVRVALSPYAMDLETNNPDRVRSYLAERNAPANYELPAHLTGAQLAGCGVKSWDNAPVAMICFRSGRPLHPGDSTDLWLFVVDRKSLPGAPTSETPVFAKVTRSMTATWTRGERTYILVGAGDQAFLEQYL